MFKCGVYSGQSMAQKSSNKTPLRFRSGSRTLGTLDGTPASDTKKAG